MRVCDSLVHMVTSQGKPECEEHTSQGGPKGKSVPPIADSSVNPVKSMPPKADLRVSPVKSVPPMVDKSGRFKSVPHCCQ